MSEFDEMIKRANQDYIDLIVKLEQQKEDKICCDKKCIYIYNNFVYDDLDVLKKFIDFDNIDEQFKQNLFYYKSCLNANFCIKKSFC